jgi:hypothetical protein
VSDKSKRRWFQFSLMGLFVLLTIAAGLSAIVGYRLTGWQQEQKLFRMNDLILSNGGYWEIAESVSMHHATATQLDTVLKELSTFDNQRSMHFDDSEFGDAHVKEILDHQGLEGITLDRTLITDEGLKELTAIKSLEWLSLEDAPITDVGLEHLTKLEHLEWLIVDGDAVTDKGLKQLAKIPSLKHVRLKGTKVTKEGIAELKLALPAIEVNKYYGSPHKYENYPDLSNSEAAALNPPKD